MHVHFSSQLQPVGGVEGTLDHMCVSPIQPNLLLGPLGAVNPGRGLEGVLAQIQQRVSGRRGSTSKAEELLGVIEQYNQALDDAARPGQWSASCVAIQMMLDHIRSYCQALASIPAHVAQQGIGAPAIAAVQQIAGQVEGYLPLAQLLARVCTYVTLSDQRKSLAKRRKTLVAIEERTRPLLHPSAASRVGGTIQTLGDAQRAVVRDAQLSSVP